LKSGEWLVASAKQETRSHGGDKWKEGCEEVQGPVGLAEGHFTGQKVYVLTQRFPDLERYGLVSQMRRAAVSIPSNIAEGQARHTPKEFVQSLSHSEGSVAELET
jgi:23S rRNA-intervening sequence protein